MRILNEINDLEYQIKMLLLKIENLENQIDVARSEGYSDGYSEGYSNAMDERDSRE